MAVETSQGPRTGMLSTFIYIMFHVVRNPGSAPWFAGMAPTVDVKYDFTPYDCTPGEPWELFSADLLRNATKTDDRGWSLADHLLGVDEGGPARPAAPIAPAAANKAAIALRRRAKESYGLLSKHVLDRDKGQFEEQETPFGVSKEARHRFDNLVAATEGKEFDKGLYLKLMGKLVWPTTMTRVDASFAVNTLCSFVHSPSAEHYKLALNIVGYLSATKRGSRQNHMGRVWFWIFSKSVNVVFPPPIGLK